MSLLRSKSHLTRIGRYLYHGAMKICVQCGKEKPLNRTSFKIQRNGGYSSKCRSCLDKNNRKTNPDKYRRKAALKRVRHPDASIFRDCKSADIRCGRGSNDLDRAFIRSMTSKPCFYCGATDLRMTLDRIDNSLAHNKCNVNPACLRCNYLRGSMPYPAWMHIVPAVKEARDLGLFGTWRSKPFNQKAHLVEEGSEVPAFDISLPSKSLSSSVRVSPYSFPPVEALRMEVEATSLRAVAKRIGCSHVAVWKRLNATSTRSSPRASLGTLG